MPFGTPVVEGGGIAYRGYMSWLPLGRKTDAQLRSSASKKPSLISGQLSPGLPSGILHCHGFCVLLSLPSCSFILQSNCPLPGTYSNTPSLSTCSLSATCFRAGDTDNSGLPHRVLTKCLGFVCACMVPVTEPRASYIFGRFSTSEPSPQAALGLLSTLCVGSMSSSQEPWEGADVTSPFYR